MGALERDAASVHRYVPGSRRHEQPSTRAKWSKRWEHCQHAPLAPCLPPPFARSRPKKRTFPDPFSPRRPYLAT